MKYVSIIVTLPLLAISSTAWAQDHQHDTTSVDRQVEQQRKVTGDTEETIHEGHAPGQPPTNSMMCSQRSGTRRPDRLACILS